jgi:hypothetical protein
VRTLLISGISVIVVCEAVLLLLGRQALVLPLAGIAVALVLFLARHSLEPVEPDEDEGDAAGGQEEILARWRARNEFLVSWADGTREDWDLHLRPMLAREFSMATGIRPKQDPAAHEAAGEMVFGPKLWEWVNPDLGNTGSKEQRGTQLPGPGREALAEILKRLEQA